jgi:hypothetical protein
MNSDHEVAREMDPKAYETMKALVEIFSGPPQPLGKWRWQHRQYDLVRLDDGNLGFVRNVFDAEMDQMFTEIMEELFGPAPADVEVDLG